MISINVSELIWTVINFFLLMFLLNRFLYKPVITFMENRQARIDAGLQKEQDAKTSVKENDERLEKEKKRLEGELKRSESMLTNEKFLSKAPQAKIDEEKAKQEKYRQMMAQVEDRLKSL